MTEALTCPFCHSTHITEKYSFGDRGIHRCASCTLMFLHPKPSLQELKSIYSDHYFTNERFFLDGNARLYGYVDYIAERINKQYGYARIVDEAKALLADAQVPRGGRPTWLDVGCGLGYLLDVAFDGGFAVQGTEFNPHAVDYIRSKYVYPVDCGGIQDIRLAGRFDAVSMMDVIEHLQDPFADLRAIRRVLSDRGLLIILTMDADSCVSRLLGKRLEDFRRIREHLFFFGRRSIRAVLERSGFTVVHIHSIGQTFQIGFLLDRISIYSPALSRLCRWLIHPKWLLEANCYINPGTKMIVFARPLQEVHSATNVSAMP